MEIEDIYAKLQIISANEELSDIVATYGESMTLIIKVLTSNKSSDTQKKSALIILDHIKSRLKELYDKT